MKIRKGFVVREVAGTIVVVPTGELLNEFTKIITLTDSAKFIWELLQEDITIEEIINKLVEEYDITQEIAKSDAEKFVNHLIEINVIEK